MKTKGKVIIFIFFIVFAYSCTTSRPYSSRGNTVTTQIFYDELSPYGDWVHNREYGYVWIPHTGRNFYPYATNGRWIYTAYGWTWFSDYEWGWAPFHYGRWDYDPQYGWFWFPGDEWAPAWVSWRHGDGYYGWAPLRPESGLGRDYQAGFNDDLFRWVFVRERDFAKPNVHRYYINKRRNDEIFRSTRVIDDYDNPGRRAYAVGPDPREVESLSGRRIRQVQVRDSNMPGRRLNNNQLEIYRPGIEKPEGQRPAPSRITDIKEIRPMRERNRIYQPEEEVRNEGVRDYGGQGERDINREQVQNRREKDVQRQYEEKQLEMQRRQDEREMERERRQIEEARQRQEVEREYRQNRSERVQKIEQQRKTIQKDTARTKRSESVDSRSVRQNRR